MSHTHTTSSGHAPPLCQVKTCVYVRTYVWPTLTQHSLCVHALSEVVTVLDCGPDLTTCHSQTNTYEHTYTCTYVHMYVCTHVHTLHTCLYICMACRVNTHASTLRTFHPLLPSSPLTSAVLLLSLSPPLPSPPSPSPPPHLSNTPVVPLPSPLLSSPPPPSPSPQQRSCCPSPLPSLSPQQRSCCPSPHPSPSLPSPRPHLSGAPVVPLHQEGEHHAPHMDDSLFKAGVVNTSCAASL